MEKRKMRISIGKSGGNAGKDSKTYKISLPTSWVCEMGITEDDRNVELTFDGEKISIIKPCGIDDFILKKQSKGNRIYLFLYYNGDALCTKIAADYTEKNLCVENFTENMVKTAFGRNQAPTWEDFEDFLSERCISKDRAGLKEYLDEIGVDGYDPLEIIIKTSGKMAEDNQWLEVKKI